MKEQDNKAPLSPLEQIIADAKARREQEAKQHQATMTMLGQLKKGSIFAK